MFKNLKLSAKIGLGFGAVIIIAVIIGTLAIVSMKNVTSKASLLANEYAPSVEVANMVERHSLLTMYAIRGYGFTEEEKFLADGKKEIELVKKAIKDAKDLASKSTDLEALSKNADKAELKALEYEKLMNETEKTNKELQKIEEELNKDANHFMTAAGKFLTAMNNEYKEDLDENASNKAMLSRLQKIILINDIIDTGNLIRITTWKSIAQRDPELIKGNAKNFEKLSKMFEELEGITKKESNLKLIKEIEEAGVSYHHEMDNYLKGWLQREELAKNRATVGGEVLTAAQETALKGVKDTIENSKGAELILQSSTWVVIIGLLIAVAIAIILATFITKGITSAMTRITAAMNESSNQVAAASEQLSAASQQLSASSNEQASSIEETSASLEEMNGMVENNLKSTEKSKELSGLVKDIANKGNSSMQELVKSMAEILEANHDIEKLVKVIDEIGDKTKVIDEIVFQTKLLSFNASVEAERAGEHGRGFAVVAQEVGNLAQMSGKAALEISSMVKESIKVAENITSENKKKVERGGVLVNETAGVLKEASEKAEIVEKNATQVLDASKDQATGIRQITGAVDQLNKATQENASTAEEAASSSEELSAQAEALRGFVRELNEMVVGKNKSNELASSQTQTAIQKPTKNETGATIHHVEPKKIKAQKAKGANPSQLKVVVGHDVIPSGEGGDDWEKL